MMKLLLQRAWRCRHDRAAPVSKGRSLSADAVLLEDVAHVRQVVVARLDRGRARGSGHGRPRLTAAALEFPAMAPPRPDERDAARHQEEQHRDADEDDAKPRLR